MTADELALLLGASAFLAVVVLGMITVGLWRTWRGRGDAFRWTFGAWSNRHHRRHEGKHRAP